MARTLSSAGRLHDAIATLDQAQRDRPDHAGLLDMKLNLEAVIAASVPLTDYNRFRQSFVLPGAPAVAPQSSVIAFIDGRDRSALEISATLESLTRLQSVARRIVVSTGDTPQDFLSICDKDELVLMLDAGVVVEAGALDWLRYALSITSAAAAYGDDDKVLMSDGGDSFFCDPAFHSTPHPMDLATTPREPAMVLFDSKLLVGLKSIDRRAILDSAFSRAAVAHVPLLLSSDLTARSWSSRDEVKIEVSQTTRICVIIPTRDEGVALSIMVESLISTARHSSTIEIIVVDNGSRELQTLELLKSLVDVGKIRVLTIDEPFNWSYLNNRAALETSAEILLFVNNDMQMLTASWDDHLRHHLSLPGVALVGARLVYPGGGLQHAGVALGIMGKHLVHEGLGAGPLDAGPLARWSRNHPVAAVTGAFMGVSREVFECVGGFDEAFAIGCNDIDFCLRVRRHGGVVLYVADLELIHAESLSRGHDDTEVRMRRADEERASLFRIWGADAARDPGRNPHWVNHETLLYYGVRKPDLVQVEAWIRRSTDLWAAVGQDAQ